MLEREIPGQTVLNWMQEAGVEDLTRILVGCGVDDNKHEHLLNIIRVEPSRILVCELAGELIRIGPQRIPRYIVVDRAEGLPLARAVEQSIPPGERRLMDARRYLGQNGINADKITSEGDVFTIRDMMKAYEDHTLPSPSQLNEGYEAFKKSGLHHDAARVFDRWLSIVKKSSPRLVGDLLIKLAYFRRAAGDLNGALAATDVLQSKPLGFKLKKSEKGVLATQRAAILLDIFDATRDDAHREEARRFAKMAWAIKRSPE
jgi:hypothetical protein